MPVRAQKSKACKKYVEIPLSGGEEERLDMHMAMNFTI